MRRISLDTKKDDLPVRRVSLDPTKAKQAHKRIIEFIQQLLPGTEVKSSFNGTFEFKVPYYFYS